jgi:hypothetical protein
LKLFPDIGGFGEQIAGGEIFDPKLVIDGDE